MSVTKGGHTLPGLVLQKCLTVYKAGRLLSRERCFPQKHVTASIFLYNEIVCSGEKQKALERSIKLRLKLKECHLSLKTQPRAFPAPAGDSEMRGTAEGSVWSRVRRDPKAPTGTSSLPTSICLCVFADNVPALLRSLCPVTG